MNLLRHKRILITAGPTWEMIDPVRFLSNRSSGLMGFELAKAAAKAGAKVTLITGPVTLPDPKGITVIRVVSARDMHRACLKHFPKMDMAIMTAAVSDYRPAKIAKHKIKKCLDTKFTPGMTGKTMTLNLVRNPDILAALGKRKKKHQMLIGFALESRNMIPSALDKLKRKNCDMVVANAIAAMAGPVSDITLLFKDGRIQKLGNLQKRSAATQIITHVMPL